MIHKELSRSLFVAPKEEHLLKKSKKANWQCNEENQIMFNAINQHNMFVFFTNIYLNCLVYQLGSKVAL